MSPVPNRGRESPAVRLRCLPMFVSCCNRGPNKNFPLEGKADRSLFHRFRKVSASWQSALQEEAADCDPRPASPLTLILCRVHPERFGFGASLARAKGDGHDGARKLGNFPEDSLIFASHHHPTPRSFLLRIPRRTRPWHGRGRWVNIVRENCPRRQRLDGFPGRRNFFRRGGRIPCSTPKGRAALRDGGRPETPVYWRGHRRGSNGRPCFPFRLGHRRQEGVRFSADRPRAGRPPRGSPTARSSRIPGLFTRSSAGSPDERIDSNNGQTAESEPLGPGIPQRLTALLPGGPRRGLRGVWDVFPPAIFRSAQNGPEGPRRVGSPSNDEAAQRPPAAGQP